MGRGQGRGQRVGSWGDHRTKVVLWKHRRWKGGSLGARRSAWASAEDFPKQRHHSRQSLDALYFIRVCIVYAPELSQQAHQLCIQKPLEGVVGLPGKEEGNKAAGSLILRPQSPTLPLQEVKSEH